MKIQSHPPFGIQGNTLLLSVFATALVGFALLGYLRLVTAQHRTTMRSQGWNSAIPVIEAGLEEAMAHLNTHGGGDLACDGWSAYGSTYVSGRRYIGGSNIYIVTITNYVVGVNTNNPIVESRGYVGFSTIASVNRPGPFLADLTPPPGYTYLKRGVRIRTRTTPVFSKGMVAKDTIDLNGNNIRSDSYDSSDPNWSTNGLYDPNRFKANGDIATNSGITNSLNVGNANIYGHVATGPDGSVAIGANGVVGDVAFHDANTRGIQDGYSKNDMNVEFWEVTVPFQGGFGDPGGGYITNSTVSSTNVLMTSLQYPNNVPGPVITNSTTTANYPVGSAGPVLTNWTAGGSRIGSYTYPTFSYYVTNSTTNYQATYYDHIFDDEDYQLATLTGSVYVRGDAEVYVTETLSLQGLAIKPGETFNLYSGAANVALCGNRTANSDGKPESFAFWGLNTCTNVSFGGNAGFTGTIYAPEANFQLNGTGKDTVIDFTGASITKTVQMNGHFNFHYDEALRDRGPKKGYVVTAWNEMPPSELAEITYF